jgi:methionine synthase II (cobalamin-independent)
VAAELTPIRSTGIGSWPGQDMAEALKINFAECPELPYLPELPARGVGSGLVGRGVAVLEGLSVDLQPAGWRLTDAPGRDHLRARAVLRDDLDQLEEAAQDYAGPFKIAVVGPWTLAASVERPRGDRVLADHGARRDIVQSLAEGVSGLITGVRRRLPGLELIIQLDEPLLPAVLTGTVPTASGFSRHRRIEPPEVSEALTLMVQSLQNVLAPEDSAEESGADAATGPLPRTWLHSCAADVPVQLIRNAGVGGVALDLDQLQVSDWDAVGAAMSDGMWLGAGALSTGTGAADGRSWSPDPIGERVLRAVRTLGLEPEVASRMLLTPACGLARFDQRSAVNALRALRKAADIVTDQLPR